MSYLSPAPYTLTDAEIAAVVSAQTVATAYKGLPFGNVGTICFATVAGGYTPDGNPGDTLPGADLTPYALNPGAAANPPAYGTLSGTWQCLGALIGSSGGMGSLFQRIA